MSHHSLEFLNVSFRYPDGYTALRNISFRIEDGEKVAVVGANGAGKSTLIMLTNGLFMSSEGAVFVGGMKVSKRSLTSVRRQVGLVFQDSDNQLFMPTVAEDVGFGLYNMGFSKNEVEERVGKALKSVGADGLGNMSPHRLSGGQKKRVAIAGVLAMQPDILIMDEPTSNLDLQARQQIIELICSFPHTTLIATHDTGLIKQTCNRVLILDKGQLVAEERVVSHQVDLSG